MTKAAKVVYLVALLVGLAVGIAGGFWIRVGALRAFDDFARISAPNTIGDFSYLQYRYADSAHSKEAAQLSVNFLKEMEELQPAEAQEIDLAVSYTRLAILADQVGDSEQSRDLLAEARRWYKSAGSRDLSDTEMKAGLKARDDVRAGAFHAVTLDNVHH